MLITKADVLRKLSITFDESLKRGDYKTCKEICDSMYYIISN